MHSQPVSHPTWRVWLLASRPATLPAAIVPVLVGTALAAREGSFRPDAFVVALLASILIQLGTNFANDLFDFRKGADTADRLGPTRATQSGLLTERQVAQATFLVFGLSVLLGLYLVWLGGWPILLIGVASILAAVAYTGGPWPLGYHGLGDLTVFLFFGLIPVSGTYYLHAGWFSPSALVIALPVAAIVTAILAVNNLRDVDTDRATGKRTLAVFLGRDATRAEYLLLLAVAYAVPPTLWLAGWLPPWAWLPWLTAPLGLKLARAIVGGTTGTALNPVLKWTGQLHLLFGVLYSLALLPSR